MIVSLDIVYHSQFYFMPLRTPEGLLYGAELITNFVGVDSPVRIPTGLISPYITAEQELALFKEKLSLLGNYEKIFQCRELVIWLNISEEIVSAILSTPELIARLKQLSFIALTINENFSDLNLGNDNLRLRELGRHFPLALANFGAGIATTKSIFDGVFTSVRLDRAFIQKQLPAKSFVPFMMAIRAQLSPFCRDMLVAGIDDEAARSRVAPLGFSAMQGGLWPAVPVDSLSKLIPLP
ncbi:EAL domain-containing protein [Enterobacteriaceae bacterium H11S18]|uniref:EAL domain-containing protein n=1 Tax=Dryocola clanedunensis TaxID=2925396 RepID=UPI0022F00DB7|nr:EAL domain-containing protein [Dryocola clanedunensis]MCT4713051.1 EAL domain-containing protein [Dryocola clanedunensis]